MKDEDQKDSEGELIMCFRSFFRDVKEKAPSMEVKALTLGRMMNVYFHFGYLAIHPTRNLILFEPAVGSGAYNTNLFSFREYGHSRGPFEVKGIQGVDVEFKHIQQIKAKDGENGNFNFSGVTESNNLARGYGYAVAINEKEQLFKVRFEEGHLYQDVFRITEEQRELFMKLHKGAFSDLISFEKAPKKKNPKPDVIPSVTPEKEIQFIEEYEQEEKEKSLYLMKDKQTGFYKIGISFNPKLRESTLMSQKPTIKLVGWWESLACNERCWHKFFSSQRERGEWFSLTPAQVRFFVSKCCGGNPPPLSLSKIKA